MNRGSHVIWYIALVVLVPLLIRGEVIDDFSTPSLNNLGGIRSGHGVDVALTYPRTGITIPTKHGFLIETLTPDGIHLNLTGKSLRIEYTAFRSGGRTIQYFQPLFKELRAKVTPHEYNVALSKGRHHIDIPLTAIVSTNDSRAHAFGIGGPLFVHRLDLVETIGNSSNITIKFIGKGTQLHLNSYTIRHTNTPPQNAFVRFSLNVNLNNLQLRRDGMGIENVENGIEIKQGGFIYESLVRGTDQIDLTHKQLRITYSARNPCLVIIKLRYHLGSVHDGAEVASTFQRNVQAGGNLKIIIPFSHFPGIRPLDGKSISISGLVTVHKIKLYEQNGALPFPEVSGGWFQNSLLVDDMAMWPSGAQTLNDMFIVQTDAYPDIGELGNSTKAHGVGRNTLNQPCMGKGVMTGQNGIKVSDQGSIYEHLSSRNKIFDLTHAHLEFEYSAERQITLLLSVLSVLPNDKDSMFHVEPVPFKVVSPQGTQKAIRVSVGVCGPSIAFRITGHGEVTIHALRLKIPATGQPDTFTTVIIDDFVDWPLLDSDQGLENSSTNVLQIPPHYPSSDRRAGEISSSNLFNYSRRSDSMPVLRHCHLVNGCGVEIMEGGYLSQLHPSNNGMHMKITYSSSHLGTRQIVFIEDRRDRTSHRHLVEATNHVVFNSGQFKEVVFPVDSNNTVIAIRIHGPLVVHQIEYVQHPKDVRISPGQSTADALLIDDFSSGHPLNSNLFDGERLTTGVSAPGSITLGRFPEFLAEGIQGEWNLKNLRFRITYTTTESTTCKMMLISESMGDHDWYGLYPENVSEFKDVVFEEGKRKQMYVPALWLLQKLSDRSAAIYGFTIHGPITGAPLTLHRIELTGECKYSESMKPSAPTFIISKLVSDYERAQSQVD